MKIVLLVSSLLTNSRSYHSLKQLFAPPNILQMSIVVFSLHHQFRTLPGIIFQLYLRMNIHGQIPFSISTQNQNMTKMDTDPFDRLLVVPSILKKILNIICGCDDVNCCLIMHSSGLHRRDNINYRWFTYKVWFSCNMVINLLKTLSLISFNFSTRAFIFKSPAAS